MKHITIMKYRAINQYFHSILGTMPVMDAYARTAEQFFLSEDAVRRIVWLMRKKARV